MNRIAATCQNGCIVKIDEYPVHTIQNHHPTKMDILPKTFVQIILGAKWLVRHSSRRPQPTATTFAFPSVFFLQHHQTVLVIDGWLAYLRLVGMNFHLVIRQLSFMQLLNNNTRLLYTVSPAYCTLTMAGAAGFEHGLLPRVIYHQYYISYLLSTQLTVS